MLCLHQDFSLLHSILVFPAKFSGYLRDNQNNLFSPKGMNSTIFHISAIKIHYKAVYFMIQRLRFLPYFIL